MKIKSKARFVIQLGIYPFDVLFSINETDESLIRFLRNKGYSIDDTVIQYVSMTPTQKGKTLFTPKNHTIIRICNCVNEHDFLSVLAHEIYHAVFFILEKVGIKHDLETSDEAYAYAIEYLTHEFLKKYDKQ